MLMFAIVFRHPDTCSSYKHTSTLLERTLYSISNQGKRNFRSIVVCNKKPEFASKYTNVTFREVDFPIPVSRHEMLMDKGVKRLVALQAALEDPEVSHIMTLDADDLVASDLTERVEELLSRNPNGLCVQVGYLLDFNNSRLQKKYGFNYYCGSSLVLNCLNVLSTLNCEKNKFTSIKSYNEFIENCDNYVIKEILGDHRAPEFFFKERGQMLKNVYEPLVSWVVNNGENLSKTTIGYGSRDISPQFLNRFGIRELDVKKVSINDKLIEMFRFYKSYLGFVYRCYFK